MELGVSERQYIQLSHVGGALVSALCPIECVGELERDV